MNLADVMQEIADQLDTITGLRVFGFPPDRIVPPAAFVSWPDDLTFDETYGRGSDHMTLPVVVVEGRPSDRTSVLRLGAYCDGSGPASVKAVVESGTYTAFDTVRVMSAELDVVTIAGTDYIAALFSLDIAGQGA